VSARQRGVGAIGGKAELAVWKPVGDTCTLTSCNAGWGNCDGNQANGCETSLTTLSNCGACGRTCDLANASESCASGTCTLTSCNAGWGNCDGNATNGCETNLLTSTANCGSCGNNCLSLPHVSSASCSSGSCSISGCANAYAECDNVVSNGCERLLDDNFGSCPGISIGSISGDTGGGTSSVSLTSYGEYWARVQIREDDGVNPFNDITARVTLDVPAGVDYDIRIYCPDNSCSTYVWSGTAGTGTDESVNIGWGDTFASSDTHSVNIWVYFYSGSTLDCGTWTLTVTGDTSGSYTSCP